MSVRLRNVREREVWAAVYARHVDRHAFSPPQEISMSGGGPYRHDLVAEYEANVASQAYERADAAVLLLRDASRERR